MGAMERAERCVGEDVWETGRAGGGAWATGLSNSSNRSSSQVQGMEAEGTMDAGALNSAALVLKTSLLKNSITLIAHGELLYKCSR